MATRDPSRWRDRTRVGRARHGDGGGAGVRVGGSGRGSGGGDGHGRRESGGRSRSGISGALHRAGQGLRVAGRAIWAHGPLILVTTGILFLFGMVIFLYFVPLPTPVVPVATRVFDRNGELVGSIFSQNRIPVSISEVPETLRKGIVALEDERFYQHHGVDPIGILRAAVRDIRAGKVVEGGSTITAQVARTLYLTQEVTVSRKVVEALLALKLERVYSKEEILELYLNGIYFGNGSYGIEVASETYFGKNVKDLSIAEQAMVAGVIASPEPYSPYNHFDTGLKRRNFVLDFWAEKGVITAAVAAEAKQEPLTLSSSGPPTQIGQYFMDYVVSQLNDARSQGAKIPTMSELYVGGYRLYTTLDVKMQQAADKAAQEAAPPGEKDAAGVTQPQLALVAMDPSNGYILAMVGGRSFQETQLNRAVPPGITTAGMRRQPGSSFKPFLYTAVLDSGFPLTSTQVCEPVSYPSGSGVPYSPTDYGAEPYHYAPLNIREAIRISDNVVAVKWAHQVGVNQLRAYAQKMGIDAPLTGDLSLALGSSEVSVLEMARGYSTMANGGFRVQPQSLLRLEDRYGKVIFDNTRGTANSPQRAISPEVAYLMNRLLQEPFQPGGTAAHLASYLPGRTVSGKTGTTDSQYDTWFVGYTPQVVCAVWVGNDTPSTLAGYGGTLAGPIWGQFMAAAHQGLPAEDYAEPAGIVHAWICPESGFLAGPTCPDPRDEIFLRNTEPRRRDPSFYRQTGDATGQGVTRAAGPWEVDAVEAGGPDDGWLDPKGQELPAAATDQG